MNQNYRFGAFGSISLSRSIGRIRRTNCLGIGILDEAVLRAKLCFGANVVSAEGPQTEGEISLAVYREVQELKSC